METRGLSLACLSFPRGALDTRGSQQQAGGQWVLRVGCVEASGASWVGAVVPQMLASPGSSFPKALEEWGPRSLRKGHRTAFTDVHFLGLWALPRSLSYPAPARHLRVGAAPQTSVGIDRPSVRCLVATVPVLTFTPLPDHNGGWRLWTGDHTSYWIKNFLCNSTKSSWQEAWGAHGQGARVCCGPSPLVGGFSGLHTAKCRSPYLGHTHVRRCLGDLSASLPPHAQAGKEGGYGQTSHGPDLEAMCPISVHFCGSELVIGQRPKAGGWEVQPAVCWEGEETGIGVWW